MSALLTTTVPKMKATIEALEAAGLRDQVKVMVGGAPVTQAFADEIGADGYGANAGGAVDTAKALGCPSDGSGVMGTAAPPPPPPPSEPLAVPVVELLEAPDQVGEAEADLVGARVVAHVVGDPVAVGQVGDAAGAGADGVGDAACPAAAR